MCHVFGVWTYLFISLGLDIYICGDIYTIQAVLVKINHWVFLKPESHESLSFFTFSMRSSTLPKDIQRVDGRASIQTLVLVQGHSLPHVQK